MSNNKAHLVTPHIRFKDCINDWEQDKLSNLIVANPFKQYLNSPSINNGKYPVIQQGFDPIVGYADGEPFIEYRSAILFGDHTLSLYKPKEPFFVATDGLRIITSLSNMEQNYMFALIERNMPFSEGYKRNFGILKELNVFYTKNKKEQCKIGDLFENIDQLIIFHQYKHDKLVNIKSSLLQKMFNCGDNDKPKIRFKGFTNAWEQYELGELYNFLRGKGLPLDSFYNGKGNLSIAYGHLYTQYDEVISKVTLSSKDTSETKSKYGDILFPGSSTVPLGTAQATALLLDNVQLGGDIIIARAKGRMQNPKFISYQINAEKEKLFPIITGTTIAHMYGKDIANIKYRFTNLNEQNKIGNLFYNLDQLITLHQQKHEKLINVKSALLNKMFI